MSERSKTAYYRRCYLTDGQNIDASGGQTLQDLLTTAAKSAKRPWLRSFGLSSLAHQLLTELMTKNSCLCGELVYYEPGRKIPLVDIESDGSTWQDTIHPKDSTGKVRQFQEQSLFFAVRENHVAIMQSVSLQSDELQTFFSWLIKDKGQLIPNALLALQNLPSQSALNKLKDHKIRSIKFGEQLFTTVREPVAPEPGKPIPKRTRYITRIDTSPRIVHILKSLGIAQPIIDKLSKNPDPGAVQVDVEISYRSRTEKEAVGVLYTLAATLGKQDGLDTEIRLEGSSIISGDELTLKGVVPVQCPNGCVSVDDALTKLSKWLASQIKSGKLV